MNILRGIVRGDFKFTKPKDSMAYLVDYIDSFSEGKISSKIRRKIKAKKGAIKRKGKAGKIKKKRAKAMKKRKTYGLK